MRVIDIFHHSNKTINQVTDPILAHNWVFRYQLILVCTTFYTNCVYSELSLILTFKKFLSVSLYFSSQTSFILELHIKTKQPAQLSVQFKK